MDILQLKYFQAVALDGHLTKTAERLHVSQPALTGVIKRLEKELGVVFFDHIGRRIVLNQNGRLFLSKVNIILEQVDTFQKEVQHAKEIKSKKLTVCVTGISFARQLLKNFATLHPEINVRQILIQYEKINSSIHHEDVDFVLTTYPFIKPGIKSRVIWKETLLLAVPLEHHLADRNFVSLSELKDEPFICLPKGYAFRKLVDQICQEAGFLPNVVMECFPGQVEPLVKDGLGITITTAAAVTSGEYTDGEDIIIRLKDKNCFREISLLWQEEVPFTEAARKFYKYIEKKYPFKK